MRRDRGRRPRQRLGVGLVVVALVSVAAGAGVPIGAASVAIVPGTTGWSIVPSANPPRPAFGALNAVACSAPTDCFVAGSSSGVDIDNVTLPVVAHLTGDAGQVIPAPVPSGSAGPSSRSRLLGIACPTPVRCFAVGSYAAGSGASTLIEQWDGASWSLVSSANPPSARGGVLDSVACPTSTTCFAVGSAFVGSTANPIVARWDGSSWAFVSNPAGPAGQTAAALSSVACPAARTCFAVGHSVVAGSYSTLVERWGGAGWSIVPSPNPTGIASLDLSAVSCGAARSCFAAGRFADKTSGRVLIERWNGSAWSIVTSPDPGAKPSFLAAVSCPSPTSCVAVGKAGARTLSERWDGKQWTVTARTNGPLYAIACPSATSCVAVGGSYQTLIERWNGRSWSRASIGGANSYLSRVSCNNVAGCLAIGQSDDGFPHPLVERWNGARWSIVAGPAPPAHGFEYLNGVSCPTSTTCFVVGEQPPNVANGLMPLVERWNGNRWSALPTPALPGVYGGLFDVSCVSETRCVAVGYRFSTDDTLIESWNGVRWTIDPSPSRDRLDNLLFGVSCTSAADCFAVGLSGDSATTRSLIEHWDGTSWAIVTSPNPSATAGALEAISCSTATSCLAVGNARDAHSGASQVEYWDGAKWSTSAFPNPNPDPATDISVGVYGVSCAAPTSCVAIGNYFDGSVTRSLAQFWNGTSWSIDPEPPLPPFADDGGLRGIACPTSTDCVGVGAYDSLQSKFTLAERFSRCAAFSPVVRRTRCP